MKFLYPTFLFALLAVAIPVIIHLFSFRQYRTVYFSNVNFLREIKKESKNKSKLKQLLILAARILTIIFLVFAFAQPYFPSKNQALKSSKQVVGIYIDNSFSMNALSEKGQLLEAARNKALEICMAYPPGTRFQLLTNDMLPKHQHLFNREQFIREVAEIQPSPIVIPFSLISQRFVAGSHSDPEPGAARFLYYVSDCQRPVTDIEDFGNEAVTRYILPIKPSGVANLYIDSCWFEVPAHYLKQEEEIFVRIRNSSEQSYQNLPLKMILNDSIKSITNFTIGPLNEITTSLKYTNNTSGLQLGQIEISDYPFTHDNNWFVSYFVEPHLKTLVISDNTNSSKEGADFISALFGNDSYVLPDVVNSQNLQISRIYDYNAIFLVNLGELSTGLISELNNYVAKGGSVAIFPGDKNQLAINNLLSGLNAPNIVSSDTTRQKISGIDFDNAFFTDVFRKKEENPVYPETNGHFLFSGNPRPDASRLLWFQNNDPALLKVPYENGKTWIFSFTLNKKNESFARDVIFVPVLYNIVLNSVPQQQNSLIVGKNNFYQIDNGRHINLESKTEIENKKTGERFVPSKNMTGRGVILEFDPPIETDGHYLVWNEDSVISAFAFNYDRKESDLRYFGADEMDTKIESLRLQNTSVIENAENNFAEVFDEIQNGQQLWKWFILLAILMILTEILLIRFWKIKPKT